MSWEYRVISTETEHETIYSIHEVYYDEDDKIEFWTKWSVKPMGFGDLEDLKGDLENMRAALNLPVIPKSELNVGKERL